MPLTKAEVKVGQWRFKVSSELGSGLKICVIRTIYSNHFCTNILELVLLPKIDKGLLLLRHLNWWNRVIKFDF